MRTGEAPVAPAHAILGPVVAGMSRVRHRRVSRTGRPPQGARERSGGGNQVRGDAVSYDVHPRPPLGKVLTIALTALALLAGACGTGETAAERGDPAAGLVDDGGDSGDSAAGLVDDGGDSGDSAAGLVDESDGGDASSGGGGEGAGLQRPGDGSDDAPRMVVELGPERVSLSPGGGCWITDDGSAECWDGDDEWSQDGDFVQVSAGTLFACGVTSDSSVRCWSKEHGEGFFQSWRDTTEEIPVPEGKPVMQVEVDGPHLCAVHVDGTLGCYGRKYYGIVLTSDDWEAPGLGSLPSGSFTQISTGGWRESGSTGMSCGIRADTGTLACWGYFGEQPAPEGEYSQVSVSLGLVSGELSVGGIPIPYGVGVLICGVLTDRGAECWSMDGTDEDGKRIAVKYYAPDGQFAQVSAGSEYVCGLRTEGTVECWQLDRPESSREDGAETDADYPPAEVRLPGDRRLNGISVGGGARACGIRLDGALECWNILESYAPSSEVAAPSFTVDEDVDGLFRASGSGRFGFNVEFGEGAWVPVVSSNGQYRLIVNWDIRPLTTGAGEPSCRPPLFGDATDSVLTGVEGGGLDCQWREDVPTPRSGPRLSSDTVAAPCAIPATSEWLSLPVTSARSGVSSSGVKPHMAGGSGALSLSVGQTQSLFTLMLLQSGVGRPSAVSHTCAAYLPMAAPSAGEPVMASVPTRPRRSSPRSHQAADTPVGSRRSERWSVGTGRTSYRRV